MSIYNECFVYVFLFLFFIVFSFDYIFLSCCVVLCFVFQLTIDANKIRKKMKKELYVAFVWHKWWQYQQRLNQHIKISKNRKNQKKSRWRRTKPHKTILPFVSFSTKNLLFYFPIRRCNWISCFHLFGSS